MNYIISYFHDGMLQMVEVQVLCYKTKNEQSRAQYVKLL